MKKTLKIAIAQINTTVGDFENNSRKILNFYRNAVKKFDPDLIVFPELISPGYPPEDLLFRADFIKKNHKSLTRIQKNLGKVPVVIGCIQQDKKKLFNSAIVLTRQKIMLRYDKQLLPNYSVFDEKRYFHSGTRSGLFKIKNVTIGLSICEDFWGENTLQPCLRQARAGAQILINISASPFHLQKIKARAELLKRVSLQTKRSILYVNSVGGQDELIFDGSSLVSNSAGQVYCSGHRFQEDLQLQTFTIEGKKIVLQDGTLTKVSEENPIEQIYNALVLGIRDYVQKNNFKKVILGLSGGIDSAVISCLAAAALGKENVLGVTMPSRYSSKETQRDAALVAKNLGIPFDRIPIEKVFKAYLQTLAKTFKNYPVDLTEENLQSRIRGTLLMALCNKFGALVLTTGNKAETALGYFTLYGDSAGALAPLKDISKARVYQLAHYINSLHDKNLIPQSTIDRAPSAELRPNQKDADHLPPYEIVDPILEQFVEKNLSYSEICKLGVNPQVLSKTLRQLDLNEYKRRQTPIGIKVTTRAFDKDWRIPITKVYEY